MSRKSERPAINQLEALQTLTEEMPPTVITRTNQQRKTQDSPLLKLRTSATAVGKQIIGSMCQRKDTISRSKWCINKIANQLMQLQHSPPATLSVVNAQDKMMHELYHQLQSLPLIG